MQMPGMDVDPDTLYSPVASREFIRMLFAISAASGLIFEGVDVSSAYFYGKIDTTIYMEQPTDSSGKQESVQDSSVVCSSQCMPFVKLEEFGILFSNHDSQMGL